jgi:hypothetical protein
MGRVSSSEGHVQLKLAILSSPSLGYGLALDQPVPFSQRPNATMQSYLLSSLYEQSACAFEIKFVGKTSAAFLYN